MARRSIEDTWTNSITPFLSEQDCPDEARMESRNLPPPGKAHEMAEINAQFLLPLSHSRPFFQEDPLANPSGFFFS